MPKHHGNWAPESHRNKNKKKWMRSSPAAGLPGPMGDVPAIWPVSAEEYSPVARRLGLGITRASIEAFRRHYGTAGELCQMNGQHFKHRCGRCGRCRGGIRREDGQYDDI